MGREQDTATNRGIQAVGLVLLPAIWIAVKYLAAPPDRFLPSITRVGQAAFEVEPALWSHVGATLLRLCFGFTIGVLSGIALGIALARSQRLSFLLTPSVQALRAVPPTATVPFFLLWFGFSEFGRMLLLCLGTALNVAVATLEAVSAVPERYAVLFRSVRRSPADFAVAYLLPVAVERLLPTLRVTLASCFGLELVSELLGSQLGLGYLLQSARTTLAMHTIFLVAIILGIINTILDAALRRAWCRLIFWR